MPRKIRTMRGRKGRRVARIPKKTRGKSSAVVRRLQLLGQAPVRRINIGRSLPQQLICKLTYSDIANQVYTASGVGYSYYRVSLNDLTDPDTSGSGFQSPLYDNLKALYKKWRVLSAKVKFTVENYKDQPVIIGLVAQYDPTTNSPASIANSSTYDLQSLPSLIRSNVKRLSAVGTAPTNMGTVSKKFVLDRIVAQDYLTSLNFSGGSSAPVNQAFCDLVLQSGAITLPEIGVFCSFTIEYEVCFYQPDIPELMAYD